MTTLGEMTACIADEVNQPLATVVTNAKACLSWLRRGTPDAIRRVQALAKKTSLEKVPLDVNEPGEGDHPVGAAGAIQGSQGWRISPRSLRTKDESLAKDPPTGASMPPILPPHNAYLFQDKAKFGASVAADLDAEKVAFCAFSSSMGRGPSVVLWRLSLNGPPGK